MLKTDQTLTCLGNKRIKKSAQILEALGDLDELVVSLGLVRALTKDKNLAKRLKNLQKDLLQVGGFLAGVKKEKIPWKKKTKQLKKEIEIFQDLQQKGFCLPGENLVSVFFHFARTITRRLERKIVKMGKKDHQLLVNYLNGLSLLLFWFAVREEKR